MTEDVKPRRAYRSTKRAEQVAQTRRDILATAGALFRARGYAGVSMPTVAGEAGVAVETIYRAFGSKAGLFGAVVNAAIAGGASRAEVPVEERPAIRAIIEESDPRRQVERYAATQPGIHRRAGPLLRVLSDAAPTDPELRALWDSIETSRLHGQGRFVAMLAERAALRPGLSVEEGRDGLWTLTSLAVWDLLVAKRAWSAERYERWLSDALIGFLLAD
ncbi:MAG TPA: helix-turn-helix domain-containing protein [Candidatus Limnocylindrales bacterium]|jgi:AcrR family transcriptional regulator|nr:helix-turn-helix domain-containing protein [Candidatus Limnocylindrales bacterium]